MSTVKVAYYAGTNVYYITNLLTQAEWSGDITQAARNLTLTLKNTTNGTSRAITFEMGKELRFYIDGNEEFRGIIFAIDGSDNGELRLTVHDYNAYLTKNNDSQVFSKMTASQIIKSLCNKYGIDYGHIDDTKYVIPKLILRDKTIYDMIVIALTETKKRTGKEYILGNDGGKLTLYARSSQVKRVVISRGQNLLSASLSQSIEDLRNSVRATGKSGPDKKGVTVTDSASVKKYGLMRDKEDDSEKTDKQLATLARQVLTEKNVVGEDTEVESFGHPEIIAGKMVQVSESMTGISGGYYVITDSHSFDANGKHTMKLKISKKLELNEIDYEPPQDPKTSTGKGSSSASKGKPKDTGSIFLRPTTAPVTSGFGKRSDGFHYGTDLAASGMVPIYAAADGTVTRSYRSSSYGECIILRHHINGKEYETLYAHMRSGSRKYRTGKTVKRGAIIGYMGATGQADGQHLHFEVNIPIWNASHSNAVNPANYI
jgi:murein DD-endopeptidase MepM/ murein hydrolase activator NlpD